MTNEARAMDCCRSCKYHYGRINNGNMLICAVHPYGPENENCPDYQAEEQMDVQEIAIARVNESMRALGPSFQGAIEAMRAAESWRARCFGVLVAVYGMRADAADGLLNGYGPNYEEAYLLISSGALVPDEDGQRLVSAGLTAEALNDMPRRVTCRERWMRAVKRLFRGS